MTRSDHGLAIDLNADVGEGFGAVDKHLMPLVTSANIACGGHAGDDATMAQVVSLARQLGVAIGAHPGHVDRENFGRREIAVGAEEASRLVVDQVARLERIAGEPPRHVKLHGALYHQVARDRHLADAIAKAIVERWPAMIVFAPSQSLLVTVAQNLGLRVACEAFVDRAYAPDGTLVPRTGAGALITDPCEAARQAVRLARDGVVETTSGTYLAIHADTLCIHGDGADPMATARAIQTALQAAGVAVRAWSREG